MSYDDPPATLRHLRLHNGTIWRWNRPLIGFDPNGVPHLRIEHRVLPAGPTICDMIANAALYLGLARYVALSGEDGTGGPTEALDYLSGVNTYHARPSRAAARSKEPRRWRTGPVTVAASAEFQTGFLFPVYFARVFSVSNFYAAMGTLLAHSRA